MTQRLDENTLHTLAHFRLYRLRSFKEFFEISWISVTLWAFFYSTKLISMKRAGRVAPRSTGISAGSNYTATRKNKSHLSRGLGFESRYFQKFYIFWAENLSPDFYRNYDLNHYPVLIRGYAGWSNSIFDKYGLQA